jgi:hypothetical protein
MKVPPITDEVISRVISRDAEVEANRFLDVHGALVAYAQLLRDRGLLDKEGLATYLTAATLTICCVEEVLSMQEELAINTEKEAE